jgi:hypothetical protein
MLMPEPSRQPVRGKRKPAVYSGFLSVERTGIEPVTAA